jgi:hypothetical protein
MIDGSITAGSEEGSQEAEEGQEEVVLATDRTNRG